MPDNELKFNHKYKAPHYYVFYYNIETIEKNFLKSLKMRTTGSFIRSNEKMCDETIKIVFPAIVKY